jgi:hypothetical protein
LLSSFRQAMPALPNSLVRDPHAGFTWQPPGFPVPVPRLDDPAAGNNPCR